MDWENERYVRVYTRNTVEWEMLPWQSRCVWPLLLRAVDRAGLLELGKFGMKGLAALLKIPIEIAQPGIEGLLEDGCAELRGTVIVVPNFIEAQESSKSDPQRKRESRERARALANIESVTKADEESQTVTTGHENGQTVTTGHELSGSVTTGHSVPTLPCLSEPSVPLKTIAGFATGDLVLAADSKSIDRKQLEAAYAAYPLKEGKSKGIEKLAKQVKTVEQLAELKRAIANYAEQRRLDGVFVMHFSTFAGEWRDWVDWKITAAPNRTGARGQPAPVQSHHPPLFDAAKKRAEHAARLAAAQRETRERFERGELSREEITWAVEGGVVSQEEANA